MTDQRAKDLLQEGDHLFDKRRSLLSLWQALGDHFYPERADFTASRTLGEDFADHLMTSYPLLCRRDLGNSFSAMLRPTAQEWFEIHTSREEREDDAALAWLQRSQTIQRRAMYDRVSQFHRATKEGDQDFATFGQAVISVELNRNRDALLYRCWHLRDVVWCENAEGKIDTVHRKWKIAARDAIALFPKTIDQKVRDLAKKTPYEEIELRHVVRPADGYDFPAGGRKVKTRYVSVFIDKDNGTILEEVGSHTLKYVIPRWVTVSGSQYAHSAAALMALPEARLIQAMTRTLLEAGEKATNPPMVAVQEAMRSDVAMFAGGITWVDAEYDERLGEVLRPLTQDKSGLPFGMELQKDIREILREAFFLNKLSMPPSETSREMTAFEVGQRVQEYIRQALPLFEPVEQDYNGALCEETFETLMQAGGFGPRSDIPPSIGGLEIQFRFKSPLSEAIEAQKAGKLAQAKAIIAQVADVDPTAAQIIDAHAAARDSLRGLGVPAAWMRSEEQMQAMQAYAAKQQQAQQLLASMQQGADVAKTIGEAGQAFAGAGAGQGVAA